MTLVAVNGYTAEIVPVSGPGGIVVASYTDTSPFSTNFTAEANGVMLDGHTITISGITATGAPVADPGPYTPSYSSGAIYTFNDGSLVVLEGDTTGVISANPQTSGGTTVPVSFRYRISAAGQTKLYGE